MQWVLMGLAVAAALGWLAFGLVALRVSGIKRDRDLADMARKDQARELKTATEAIDDYKQRVQLRLRDLEEEIERLEDDLESCDTPGARRSALNRLLQTASRASSDAKRRVP